MSCGRRVRCLVENHWHVCLTGPERDDAADRVVWGNPHRDSVARDYLDTEAAHPAAQLGQHFVAGITLHTVEAAAMDRHHRALNVYEVVLTQTVLTLALPAEDRPAAYTNIVPHIQSPRTASSTCRASAP